MPLVQESHGLIIYQKQLSHNIFRKLTLHRFSIVHHCPKVLSCTNTVSGSSTAHLFTSPQSSTAQLFIGLQLHICGNGVCSALFSHLLPQSLCLQFNYKSMSFWFFINLFIYYLFGVLRRFQHCAGHITTGSWKSRGNQYIQFVRVLYCKLPTNGKQLPAFPLEAMLVVYEGLTFASLYGLTLTLNELLPSPKNEAKVNPSFNQIILKPGKLVL